MPRCSRTITLFLFILYPAISFSQSSLPSAKAETITYIIKETSVQEELHRSISEIESQFSQNPFGLPASKNDQMMKLFSDHFEPETMRTSIRQAFQEQYDSQHAEATVDWLSDTTTQKVLDYEKEFYTLQGIRKRVVNKHELEQNPPTQERTDLIGSLIESMSAAQMEIEARTIIFRSMISALSELSAQRSFSESQINSFVQNFRSQLQGQIDRELTNRLLVKYHGLNDKTLQTYISFYDTDTGDWLSSTSSQAVHAALEKASEDFLNSLNTIQ